MDRKFRAYRYTFTLKDENGDEEQYTIRPLTGALLSDLYSVLSSSVNVDEAKDADAIKEVMNKETIEKMHEIVTYTLKESYPGMFKDEEDNKELEGFVTRNLFELIGHVVKANVKPGDKSGDD